MILLDPRKGSGELKSAIRNHGVEVDDSVHLKSGDFAFSGNGPDGSCMIGIERKKVPDILECIKDGRLSGYQLIHMSKMYRIVYLLVEGIWKPTGDGHITEYRRGTDRKWYWREYNAMYSELDCYLNTLQLNGVHVLRSSGEDETVNMVVDRYNNLQKRWDQHQALNMFHVTRPMLQLREPTVVAKVANCFRGVGWKMANLLAANYATPIQLAAARPEAMHEAGLPVGLADKVFREWRGL